MCDFDREYDARIKKVIDDTFHAPSEPISAPHILIGRWSTEFPNGTRATRDFDANGTCRFWLCDDWEGEGQVVDRWKLTRTGWLCVSSERKGIWYDDLYRIYVFDEDRFVLANEDASIMLEHRRL